MEFILKTPRELLIHSLKKEIVLEDNIITLDGLMIDSAGEYEKGGILMYVREYEWLRYFYFRTEGKWLGYIPALPLEFDPDTLDFFGQLDVLVAPIGKKDHKLLDVIEPRLLVSFGEVACELPQTLGYSCEPMDSYKFKESDLSEEKMWLVVLSK